MGEAFATPRALLAGGRCFILPEGAVRVPTAPLRPMPLGSGALLGLALVDGMALPVMAPAPGLEGGPAWVLALGHSGRAVLAGEAVLDFVPEEAEPLSGFSLGTRPPPSPLPPPARATPQQAPRSVRGLPAALALELGGQTMVLPIALLDTVIPMPMLGPAKGMGEAVLGIAMTAQGPVPVLDPAQLAEAPPDDAKPTHLVLFRHAGRRLGLPCTQLGPAQGGARLAARLDALVGEIGPAAVEATMPIAPEEPMLALLFCETGGEPFAVPAEEVDAAIPPTIPAAAPEGAAGGLRGVVAHRGEVLPVIDGGERLGRAPVMSERGREVPLLRLAGRNPVALAVNHVSGLRQVPERLLEPVSDHGPAFALAVLGGVQVPVCHAAALTESVA